MLRTIRIRHFVIVDDLTVEFDRGLNLLTGETGAGKSILVGALGLATGARADREVVRTGCERAIVEAVFDWPATDRANAWAAERGLPELVEEGEVAIRREVPRSGPGRVYLNGSPTTAATLRDLGPLLLELHGQHEHHALLAAERQLEILDSFGNHAAQLERTAAAYAGVVETNRRREELRSEAARRSERIAELEAIVAEIEGVNPRPGELDELDRERSVLRNAETVSSLLDRVVDASYDGDPSAAGLGATAARFAGELAEIDSGLAEVAERMSAAAVELQEAGESFRDYRDRIRFEPGRLDVVEERRAAIERLLLRHGPDEAAALAEGEEAGRRLLELQDADDLLERLDREVADAEGRYEKAAAKLSALRKKAAAGLGPAVEEQLAALALPRARFGVELPEARGDRTGRGVPLSPRGRETASFGLAANPGEPSRPLHKAASGGELARVMLALNVACGDPESAGAVVFDEIDAGVGGAVADAVGARLAHLAARRQVLCVTHLPQVAAYADFHLAVRKLATDERTVAEVRRLDESERVEELARMLGAKRITDVSRKHAREMLGAAARVVRPAARREA